MHKYTHTHNHTHSNRCTEAPFPKPAQRLHALTVFLIYARAENCLNCLVDVFVFVYVCVRAHVYMCVFVCLCVCVFVCLCVCVLCSSRGHFAQAVWVQAVCAGADEFAPTQFDF